MKFISALLSTASVAALTACGGGGAAIVTPAVVESPVIAPVVVVPVITPVVVPVTDLATKYEGTWIACVPATERPEVTVAGTQRVKETLTIVKTGLATFSYTLLQVNLPPLPGGAANLGCTGALLSSLNSAGTGSIVGTKSVGGRPTNPSVIPGLVVTEKLDLTETSPSFANFTDIAYFSGNTFQLGVNGLALDGYPDGLLFVDYVKQ